ncbi:NAD(P)-binding protein [Lipomyces doorenjongii]
MADSIVVLITGVSRGIGKTLLETYLLRPYHIVIGSVRDKTAPNAKNSTSFTDPAVAMKDLEAAGIDHIDVVIANAGGAGEMAFIPMDLVGVDTMTDVFNVNTLGPLVLYQAVRALLQKSKVPKWVSVTSAAGSIGNLEAFQAHVVPAYGLAKASLNWSCAQREQVADCLCCTPRAMGLEQAPHTKRQSIDAIIGLVDNATREKTSGKFYNVIDGTEIPW